MSELKHISELLQSIKENLMQDHERKEVKIIINRMIDGAFTGSCSLAPHGPCDAAVFSGLNKSFTGTIIELGGYMACLFQVNILDHNIKIELNHVNG